MQEIQLHVVGYADSDREERAELAWRLHDELRALDVDDVSRPASVAVPGAKGTALEWAQLVVTLAGTIPPLIAAVRGWLHRHPGAEVTLEIDGDRITLGRATSSERQALLDAWMERHGSR